MNRNLILWKNLAIADEVLRNPAQTFCRKGLIAFLKERYVTIEALNQAWKTDFGSFAALEGPVVDCSARYPGSRKDIREFSGKLITEYIRVPFRGLPESGSQPSESGASLVQGL